MDRNTTVRSLDLSMNKICGVDKLGVGTWRGDGLEAIGQLIVSTYGSSKAFE